MTWAQGSSLEILRLVNISVHNDLQLISCALLAITEKAVGLLSIVLCKRTHSLPSIVLQGGGFYSNKISVTAINGITAEFNDLFNMSPFQIISKLLIKSNETWPANLKNRMFIDRMAWQCTKGLRVTGSSPILLKPSPGAKISCLALVLIRVSLPTRHHFYSRNQTKGCSRYLSLPLPPVQCSLHPFALVNTFDVFGLGELFPRRVIARLMGLYF